MIKKLIYAFTVLILLPLGVPATALAFSNPPEAYQSLGAKLDLAALDELSTEAETIWQLQIQKFGSPAQALRAMHGENPPQEILQLAQQLTGFLLTAQATSKELLLWPTKIKMHPLLVHLLIATLVSHSEKILDDTPVPFMGPEGLRSIRLTELLMSVESPNWENYEIKKSHFITRRAARIVLVGLTTMFLWDKRDVSTAISPLTMQWMNFYTDKELHFLVESMVNFNPLWMSIVGGFPTLPREKKDSSSFKREYKDFKRVMGQLSPIAE